MPRVSVIIPAYHSFTTLPECLLALRKQTFRDFEVIVVNSSPETKTGELVSAEFSEALFIQSPSRLLPHAARNRGVEEASGELLVFTDPDCIAHPDWLLHLTGAWEQGHLVIGGSMGLVRSTWFERAVHLCKFHPVIEGSPQGPRWILPTANVAYDRRVWAEIGPFAGDCFTGDAIQCWRAAAAGFPLWFEPRAVVAHTHGGSTLDLVRQRLSRGREFGYLRAKHNRWSPFRAAMEAATTPARIVWVLMIECRDALNAGWAKSFVTTLPVQIVGQTAWATGEAWGFAGFAINSPAPLEVIDRQ